jgi:hypothetical protein
MEGKSKRNSKNNGKSRNDGILQSRLIGKGEGEGEE